MTTKKCRIYAACGVSQTPKKEQKKKGESFLEEKDFIEEQEELINVQEEAIEEGVEEAAEDHAEFQEEAVQDGVDEQQIMRDLCVEMKELREEVKRMREQSARMSKGQVADDQVFFVNQDGEEDTFASNPAKARTEEKEVAQPKKKKKTVVSVITDLCFYLLIITLVFGAFLIRSSKNGRPWMLGGYSAMTVLTGSMEDVYPQGSLIITKSVAPDKLKIGDDITYMTGETSSITHRIIGITENYLETGKRGFETQGVMNDKPDKDIVAASNVVGRVIFCSKTLGMIAAYIRQNWPFLLFLVLVLVGLCSFLQWNSKRPERSDDKTSDEKKSKKKQKKQKKQKKTEDGSEKNTDADAL